MVPCATASCVRQSMSKGIQAERVQRNPQGPEAGLGSESREAGVGQFAGEQAG